MDASVTIPSAGSSASATAGAGEVESAAGHVTGLVSVVTADGRIRAQFGPDRILGRGSASRVGQNLFEFAHPDDLPRALAWLAALAAESDRIIADLELRERHVDGAWRHVRIHGTNLLSDPAIGGLLAWAHDGTLRVAAPTAFEPTPGWLHHVAAGSRLCFFEYDVATARFDVSDEWYLMRGLGSAAGRCTTGAEFVAEIRPVDRSAWHAGLDDAITGPREAWDAEYRVATGAGGAMWIEQRGRVVERDAAGRATRIAGVLLDIDQRKRAERGLVDSESRYRTIVAMTPGFVHETVRDADGQVRMKWASEGLTRQLGGTVAELNERGGWASIVHPEHRDAAANRTARVFAGEPVREETRLVAKSGESLWFDLSLFPLTDPETGCATASLGMLYDITARKQAEEMQRASEERFRLAAAAVQGVIYERDPTTGIVSCSSGVNAVLGLGAEARRQSVDAWLERVHPDDIARLRAQFVRAAGERTVTAEYRLRHAQGHYVDIVDRSVVLSSDSGRAVRIVGCAIDVSRVRQTERLLREAEALAHVGSWQLDVATGTLSFSDEAYRITGTSPGDRPGSLDMLYTFIAPESAAILRAAIERAIATGEGYNLDVEIARPDGGRRWIRTSGRAEVAEGRAVRVYGAFQDIDALKRSGLRLREHGDRLRLALDAGQLAAWRWIPRDDRLVVEYRSVGFDPAIWFAETMTEDLETVVPEDRQRIREQVDAVIATGNATEYELAAIDATGARRWLRTRVIRAMTAEGPVAIGTTFDDTARHMADEALRSSESLLRSVAENSPDVILIVDRGLRITFVNRALHGEPPEEIVGRPVGDFAFDERADIEERLRGVLATGRPTRFESRAARAQGGDSIYEHRAGPVRDGERITGAIVYSTDITDRRALEREILEVSNREQRRIGSDLHDGLGQELTGIALMLGGLAQALRRGTVPKSAELRDLIGLVNGAIEQTRTLARGLSPVAFGGGGLVQALRTLVARAREMYGLDVRFRGRVDPCVTLDATATGHLYRIAQESLTNAARHAGARRVVVQLSVRGRRVSLAVSDDGRGITPGAANGAGLEIMRYRAHMLGGELLISTRADGKGTRVACILQQPEPANGAEAVAEISSA